MQYGPLGLRLFYKIELFSGQALSPGFDFLKESCYDCKCFRAGMAELADAQDLGSCEVIRKGSTPFTRTKKEKHEFPTNGFSCFFVFLFGSYR